LGLVCLTLWAFLLFGCSTRDSNHTSGVWLELTRLTAREADEESEEGRP
jgi:hypothetical protein